MENNNLVIIKDSYKKEGQDAEVTGLTIMLDGVIKQVFDKIKKDRTYDSYEEVLRDIVFEGINTIVQKDK